MASELDRILERAKTDTEYATTLRTKLLQIPGNNASDFSNEWKDVLSLFATTPEELNKLPCSGMDPLAKKKKKTKTTWTTIFLTPTATTVIIATPTITTTFTTLTTLTAADD